MAGISIEPITPEQAVRLAVAGGSDVRLLEHVTQRIERLFRLRSLEMPDLFCVGAVIALDDAMARAHGGASISATGGGLDAPAAISGCLGEAAELLSQFEVEGDILPNEPSPPKIRSGWIAAAMDDAQGNPDWMLCRDALSGESACAPADLCLRRDPARRSFQAVGPLSAGCAAGPSIEAASLRATLELIERDAAALWWLGGRRARDLAFDARANAEARTLLMRLRSSGTLRTTVLLDLTTDLAIPVIAAASMDENGCGLACGVAARLDPAQAVLAAILEMGQMELANSLTLVKCKAAGSAALNDIDRRNLARSAWNAQKSPLLAPAREAGAPPWRAGPVVASLPALLDHLQACGINIYLVDHTRSKIGVPMMRALAPALQPFAGAVTTPRLESVFAQSGGARPPPVSIY